MEFGNGIRNKRTANVNVTDLTSFSKGDQVDVVVHFESHRFFDTAIGPPDFRADIVHRANWLVANHPQGRYHLVGWNCEHLATFCVNGFQESSQARTVTAVMAAGALPLLVSVALTSRPKSAKLRKYIWTWGVIALWSVYTYRTYSRRVWAELEEKWKADHPLKEV